MRKVFLIAGHNGIGSGAVGLLDEGGENLRLRNAIYDKLKKQGLYVFLDKETSTLNNVIKNINALCSEDDVCIDIHFNAFNGKANGSEVIYPMNCIEDEKGFSEKLLNAITTSLGTKNRGIKKENSGQYKRLAMLSDVNCQSVLIEVCFCDNKEDVERYQKNFNTLVRNLSDVIFEKANECIETRNFI